MDRIEGQNKAWKHMQNHIAVCYNNKKCFSSRIKKSQGLFVAQRLYFS